MNTERQLRVLMRAWPRPDRIDRGDEVVGTSLDLLPDGARHVPILLALNLVVGGLRARWRMRPPLWRWVHYRMGGRLPARWHRWMVNDLTAPGWRRRMVATRAVAIGIGAAIGVVAAQIALHQSGGPSSAYFVLPAVCFGGLVGTIGRSRKERDRQFVRNGYAWPPSNDPPWPPPPAPAAARRRGPGPTGPQRT